MNASRQVVVLAVGAATAEASQAALGDERPILRVKSSIYRRFTVISH